MGDIEITYKDNGILTKYLYQKSGIDLSTVQYSIKPFQVDLNNDENIMNLAKTSIVYGVINLVRHYGQLLLLMHILQAKDIYVDNKHLDIDQIYINAVEIYDMYYPDDIGVIVEYNKMYRRINDWRCFGITITIFCVLSISLLAMAFALALSV